MWEALSDFSQLSATSLNFPQLFLTFPNFSQLFPNLFSTLFFLLPGDGYEVCAPVLDERGGGGLEHQWCYQHADHECYGYRAYALTFSSEL
jgi:hypothetical protein